MAGDTIAQYLDDDGNPVGAGSGVKPPKGYSLLTSKKSPATPKKTAKPLKEVKAQADKLKPVTPPSGYVVSAYSPSHLEQIRNVLANSAIGHSLESTLPKLADALNLHPSESLSSPTYAQHGQQLLSPEYLAPTVHELAEEIGGYKGAGTSPNVVHDPAAKPSANEDRAVGALRAAGGLTSGKSMATMAATAVGAGITAGVINPASAQVLSRLVSGGFTLDMLHSLYQQHGEYRKAVDSGDEAEAHKIQGEMGVTGIMALLTGHHAFGRNPVPLVDEEPFHEEKVNGIHNSPKDVSTSTPDISDKNHPEPIQEKPINKKVQADANEFKTSITAPITNEEGLAIPSVDVDVKFPPPKEMETAWRDASMNQELHAQFKRTGIGGFSIEEPYKFGLSEQGNIDPKTGKIAINAAASNPTHTLAHEVAHDIYNRLTPKNKAEIDRYIGGASHIYPEHGGGLEERIMDHFADEIAKPMSASAPPSIRKIFFESPLEPRPERVDKAIPEETAIEPKRPIYGTWSNVALSGGYLRAGDDIRGLVEKDGDFPLVLKDTYGSRHVIPASIAADVLDSPAHNYVREVFMAKDHVHDDATSKLEKDLSDKKKMLAANAFMSHEMVDGKMVNEPDPKKPLHDKYRKELEADVPKIEKILEDRKAGVPHQPVPTYPKDAVHTQPSGARMLTDAIQTFGNREKLAQEYKVPQITAREDTVSNRELGQPSKIIVQENRPDSEELKAKRTELSDKISELSKDLQRADADQDVWQKIAYEWKNYSKEERDAAWEEKKKVRDEWWDKHVELGKTKRELDRIDNPRVGELREDASGRKTLWLSKDAMWVVQYATKPGIGNVFSSLQGVSFPKEDISTLTRRIDLHFGRSSTHGKIIPQVKNLLTEAANHAGKEGVTIVGAKGRGLSETAKTAREEMNHAWQREMSADGLIGSHLTPDIFESLNGSVPGGAQEYLRKNGYPDDPVTNVVETAAKLMSGGAKALGVSPAEEAYFLHDYFQYVIDQHGTKAFNTLNRVMGVAKQLKEEALSGKKDRFNLSKRAADEGTLGSQSEGGSEGNSGGDSKSSGNEPLFNRERREDSETRKRVEDMTPEEMRKALLTSDKTGIPNRRAFDDAEHASPSPAVAMSDADGLKALNDKFGYAAGDELLKAKAEALKAAGLDAYHEKGDEFLYRGASPQDLKDKLDKARQLLRDRTIEVTLKDGKKLYFKGADFSYGTGKDLDESEDGLKQHKETREKAGERARGELRGITQTESGDGSEPTGDAK